MAGAPHLIPDYLRPVYDFVNSIDIEAETDVLTTPAELTSFLLSHELMPSGEASTRELRLALSLRQALRAFALANNGIPASPADTELAAKCFDRLPTVAGGPAGAPLVASSSNPVLAGLTEIVIGYATGRATGEWDRLRQCPAEDCAWVFWDRSPRAARRWCSMKVCGNRSKARAYAARRRSAE
jgi:predicted RNA-binding Zn ribbon-like protein